jgi:hypothetical protein
MVANRVIVKIILVQAGVKGSYLKQTSSFTGSPVLQDGGLHENSAPARISSFCVISAHYFDIRYRSPWSTALGVRRQLIGSLLTVLRLSQRISLVPTAIFIPFFDRSYIRYIDL